MRMGGESIFYFKLPSVIFSLSGIFFYYLLFRELFNSKLALITAFLLSIHPVDIFFAKFGRNYAIMNLFIPVATLFFIKSINTGRIKFWCLYAISLSLCFYSHPLTIGIAVSHLIYFAYKMINHYRSGMRKEKIISLVQGYIMAGASSLSLFTPWLFIYYEHFIKINPWNRTYNVITDDVPSVFLKFNLGHNADIILVLSIFLAAFGLLNLLVKKEKYTGFILTVLVASYMFSYYATKNNFFGLRYVL